MENTANHIHVCGELTELPRLSHENRGIAFYRFTLSVRRLSGTKDLLPVVASQTLLDGMSLDGGSMLEVEGQIRSHSHTEGSNRRLQIFIYALSLSTSDREPRNDVNLIGTICKEPVLRRTPLGREICDLMLAVPRLYHRSDYLPCILWGKTARTLAHCSVGDRVQISGRLQSRDYTKITPNGPEQRRAYELSALTAEALQDADSKQQVQ